MFKIPSQISNIFKNKKVLITGHTGFKGQWLSVFLKKMDANILGISLNTKTKPSHFKLLNLKIKNKYFDISDLKKLKKTINSYQPDLAPFFLASGCQCGGKKKLHLQMLAQLYKYQYHKTQ